MAPICDRGELDRALLDGYTVLAPPAGTDGRIVAISPRGDRRQVMRDAWNAAAEAQEVSLRFERRDGSGVWAIRADCVRRVALRCGRRAS